MNKKELPESVLEKIAFLEKYEEDPNLDKFTVLYLYPVEESGIAVFAYVSKFYLIGFDPNTMKKRSLGLREELTFYPVKSGVKPRSVKIFADGSTMIQFFEPIQVDQVQYVIVSPAREGKDGESG